MEKRSEEEKMNRNDLMRLASNLTIPLNMAGVKWFVCFGTLLGLVREKTFPALGDIDIGLIGDFQSVYTQLQNTFAVAVEVEDDKTREPLQLRFRIGDYNVDVFNWKRKGGYYYHTYADISKPGKFTFKGTPACYFEPDLKAIDSFRRDLRYGRAMNKNGTWQHLVPGLETECVSVNLPFGYGACLDTWYPEWATKRDNFGQSEAAHVLTVSSCKGVFDA
jgi:hypothetical protein